MRRKIFIVMLVILFILLAGGVIYYCITRSGGGLSQNLSDAVMVKATVLAQKGDSLTVSLETNDTQYSNLFGIKIDPNTQLLKGDQTISLTSIRKGDQVQIYYSGMFGETDPPCLIGCSKIVVFS